MAAGPGQPALTLATGGVPRGAEMPEAAVDLYQKAVALAPASPQYREYLGEYYHILKRPDEALTTWRQMAEGQQRTAENLNRLAEVLAQFGYLKEALPEIRTACSLDPKDFSLHLKAADLHVKAEDYATALSSLSVADKLAQSDEEREAGVPLCEQVALEPRGMLFRHPATSASPGRRRWRRAAPRRAP
jgi:tetratricopeptide (TPR) repeat protein